MRGMTEEQSKIFSDFDGALAKLGALNPLRDVRSTSPHALQIISFHLIYEYLIEAWINFKLNGGKNIFENIATIGFHNKVYIARNIGLPKDIFQALLFVNNQRNDLAHKITKRDLDEKMISDFAEKVEKISDGGNSIFELKIMEGDKAINISSKNLGARLLVVLYALLFRVRNFVFTDLHLSLSTEITGIHQKS